MKKSILFAVLALAGVAAAPITPSLAKKAEPLVALDTDKDGTIDANALNKSAEALFDKLDKDKDGTLAPRSFRAACRRRNSRAPTPIMKAR